MSDISAATPAKKFSFFPGVDIVISDDGFHDYIEMRASQLRALLAILCLEEFESQNPATKASAKWLAGSLADEISGIISTILRPYAGGKV